MSKTSSLWAAAAAIGALAIAGSAHAQLLGGALGGGGAILTGGIAGSGALGATLDRPGLSPDVGGRASRGTRAAREREDRTGERAAQRAEDARQQAHAAHAPTEGSLDALVDNASGLTGDVALDAGANAHGAADASPRAAPGNGAGGAHATAATPRPRGSASANGSASGSISQ